MPTSLIFRLIARSAYPLAAFAIVLPSFVWAGGTGIEQRIAHEREKAQQIRSRLHAKRAELNAVTVRYTDLQRQLGETTAAIDTVNVRIGSLQTQQDSTQRRLDWNTLQLNAARASLKRHDDALKRRLVDVYEYGDLSYLGALIASRSFSEFVERWEDLRLLIAANQRAVRARKAAQLRVAAMQADLERTQLELQQEEQAQEEARSQLGSLADERRNLVELASVQRRSVASQVAEVYPQFAQRVFGHAVIPADLRSAPE